MIVLQVVFLMKVIIQNIEYSGDVMAGRPPTKEATDFGKRVADARQRLGLTQRELAERIGVSLRMMEYYERRADNVKSDVVKLIASTLNVTTDELLGVSLPKERPGRMSKLRQQIAEIERLPKAKQLVVSQVLEMAVKSATT